MSEPVKCHECKEPLAPVEGSAYRRCLTPGCPVIAVYVPMAAK